MGLVVLGFSATAVAGAAGAPGVNAAAGIAGPFYNVTFEETGLPSGTNWSVHVAYVGCACDGVHRTVTADLPALTIPLPNGTYRYDVLPVPGFFVNASARGVVSVSGAPLPNVAVVFHPVVPFSVEFTETGLPAGTSWTVSVVGNARGQEASLEDLTESSTSTTLTFLLPNGTYRYTVAEVPGSFFVGNSSHGRFNVSGASPPPVGIAFVTPPTYEVTFTESGLPTGTNWSVRVAGWGGVEIRETLASTTGAIHVALPNGTYRYSIGEVLGLAVQGPSVGNVSVTGAPVTIPVPFVPLEPGAFFPVAFEERGLENGTPWSVTITATHTFGHSRSATQSSEGTTIFVLLPNGTYRFTVHGPRGYAAAGAAGTFTIAGAAPGVTVVTFTALPTYAVTFTETGLPNGTTWVVLLRSEYTGSTVWPVRITETSTGTSVTFLVPNGSYCYRIGPVPGYRLTSGPADGAVTVSGGSPPAIAADFTARG